MTQTSGTLPLPVQGLVITFNYLWASDRASGDLEARKARPCIIAAVSNLPNTRLGSVKIVGVLPITHSATNSNVLALPVIDRDKRLMGLDPEPCWVVCSEMNSSLWPGYDLLRTIQAADG